MNRNILSAVLVSLTLTTSAFAQSMPANRPQAPGLKVAQQAQAEAAREAHKAKEQVQAIAAKTEAKAQEKADKAKAQVDKAHKELAPKPGVRRGQTGTAPAAAPKAVATDTK